jgi:two-component system sensor histidine kinase KdpD
VADYLKAECFAVYVTESEQELAQVQTVVEQHLDFARKLHIETRVLTGLDVAETLVDFARRNQVTQIFLTRPPQRKLPFLARKHFVMNVVRMARDMQVTVVAERRSA